MRLNAYPVLPAILGNSISILANLGLGICPSVLIEGDFKEGLNSSDDKTYPHGECYNPVSEPRRKTVDSPMPTGALYKEGGMLGKDNP